MIVFWRLLAAHFIADFTFQTNWLAALKRQRFLGMFLHVVMHPVLSIALTYPYLGQTWVSTLGLRLNGWACVGLIFVTHFLQDQWRVYTIARFKTADNTAHFLWDQLVHYGVLIAIVPTLTPGTPGGWIPEVWPVLIVLWVLITHYATVLIYFLEKDMWGGEYPGDDEKYLTIGERTIQAMCFLLPSPWWLPAALVWFAAGAAVRWKRMLEFSWFGLLVGTAIAVGCGAAARVLLS